MRAQFRIRSKSLVSIALLLILLLLISLASCNQISIYTPGILRVGVLPDKDYKKLQTQYAPLLNYISEKTGIKSQLVIPDSYEHLSILFHQAKIDIAFFGGVTFMLSQQRDGAIPLVTRDVDLRFTSSFLVAKESIATSLKDLKGARFSFGSKLSTSGHLMPRYFMTRDNIQVDTFFSSVSYSGAHDKTALAVQNGDVDAGVANSITIRDMFKNKQLSTQKVKILWETPNYPDYVWVAQAGIDKVFLNTLRDSFT